MPRSKRPLFRWPSATLGSPLTERSTTGISDKFGLKPPKRTTPGSHVSSRPVWWSISQRKTIIFLSAAFSVNGVSPPKPGVHELPRPATGSHNSIASSDHPLCKNDRGNLRAPLRLDEIGRNIRTAVAVPSDRTPITVCSYTTATANCFATRGRAPPTVSTVPCPSFSGPNSPS